MSYLHELWRELEGTGLEPQVLGRGREYEPVVDVDEVALGVQEDVAVVTVLDLLFFFKKISKLHGFPIKTIILILADLHEVRDYAVGGAALHELALGGQEALGVGVAKLLPGREIKDSIRFSKFPTC